MKFFTLAPITASVVPCFTHKISPELTRRHAGLSSRFAAGAGQFKPDRMLKCHLSELSTRVGNITVKITMEAPYYDSLKNDTCVLTPDVTAGTYY